MMKMHLVLSVAGLLASVLAFGTDAPSSVIAGEKYELSVWGTSPVETSQLTPILDQAIGEFESKVAPLKGKLKISIGRPNCLRVGYNFTQGDVEFCPAKNVSQSGLKSPDVIRHELFHAMVCNVRPEICSASVLKSDSMIASHEALADFFAYQFAPDHCFSENFYTNQPCVRQYTTPVCYSLVDGPHEKGNALASQLVSAGLSLQQIRRAVLQSDFSAPGVLGAMGLPVGQCFDQKQAPQFEVSVSNYPASSLNKFWINATTPLIVHVQPNSTMKALYPNATIRWKTSDGTKAGLFKIAKNADSPYSFSVTPAASSGISKVIAQIFNGDDLIGDIPFYFGIKPSSQPQPAAHSEPCESPGLPSPEPFDVLRVDLIKARHN